MTLAQIIALLAVAFGIALVASGRGKGLAPLERPDLPEVRSASQIDALTFSLGVRGYRMDEVDHAIAEVREALVARDAEIDSLRAQLGREQENSS